MFDSLVTVFRNRQKGQLRSASFGVKATIAWPRYNAALTPLNSFVLPGGSPLAAYLHLARTVVRRAERAMVELSRTEKVSVQAIRYANRLSDLLFVVSRVANDGGKVPAELRD